MPARDHARYCDVSLPVPLDQPFTYALPETLRHRVQPGSRLVVPFGPRKPDRRNPSRCHLTTGPKMATRDALRLIDTTPRSRTPNFWRWGDGSPITTARLWAMFCAACCRSRRKSARGKSGRSPIRAAMPRASCCSIRPPDDPVVQILRMLEKRPLSAAVPGEGATPCRQDHPIARTQGLHSGRTGADRARSSARAVGSITRGTGRR